MTVTVNKRAMSESEFEKLLLVAKENVPFGIYAVKKANQAELLNIKCKSKSELKRYKRTYKSKGFKVYANE